MRHHSPLVSEGGGKVEFWCSEKKSSSSPTLIMIEYVGTKSTSETPTLVKTAPDSDKSNAKQRLFSHLYFLYRYCHVHIFLTPSLTSREKGWNNFLRLEISTTGRNKNKIDIICTGTILPLPRNNGICQSTYTVQIIIKISIIWLLTCKQWAAAGAPPSNRHPWK